MKNIVLYLITILVWGSIIAFYSYLTLIGTIGADKASYAIMVVPVVAGNFLALFKPSRVPA
ncbi:MAG: hypothetical protein A2277_13685 [Desulfobacterales bacterium RIFOXYA12_FULL_46_15]|nr:MAG: hypothetical protein A2097_02830 [Desulfobacula sp. GWF2_41_7]OGR23856.1 MAG: hypothetical protein A2277_13685 [Desulfobacterales bacterium RIFOXYA12_FULL_46_15]